MSYGAGVVAARQGGAAGRADPRPCAVGSIRGTYERYPHLTDYDAKELTKPGLLEILTAFTARRKPLPSKVTKK